MAIHILGIRHHGPGSARNVKAFLESVQPDIVLVEGPPDAEGILQWAAHRELKPPVAILCYQPDNPQRSAFYPFASFSPEWQAIQYARRNNIHVRWMDLPSAHQFAIEEERLRALADESIPATESGVQAPGTAGIDSSAGDDATISSNAILQRRKLHSIATEETPVGPADELTETEGVHRDPIAHLAHAAGYSDAEKWWEHFVEHRQNNDEVFEAINEAMQALRDLLPNRNDRLEQLREAWMRKVIRQAEKEMFQNIAVVCGAWHAPALQNMPKQKEDNELLKNLPKVKVECTWVPWTYSRLSFTSGYGAGITSPGWYDHIWEHPADDGTRWMAKVASLFRSKQMDTSVAHVIEAVRLAESLAALRNLSKAGLEELNEATLSILCNGEPLMMCLLHNELIVSNRMGEVPLDIPKPPLQVDIERQQKKLRMPPTADWKDYTLDLRKENDLDRSVLLHRLLLLGIRWGTQSNVNSKGTFKEQWRLQWDPAFSIDVIEKGSWGNTVEEAAAKLVMHEASNATSLKMVCTLLEQSIPADLPPAVSALVTQINNLAAASGDVIQLMEVIPALVNVSRYGNVRNTDAAMVLQIVNSMITRICVSLPAACTGIDEDAALVLLDLCGEMNGAVSLLQQQDITAAWQQTLQVIAENNHTAPAIAGYATRLLADYSMLTGDALSQAFYYAMSTATAPGIAAAWLEGFLKGSGTILLVDEQLWTVVNNWVMQLDEDSFIQVLPLLRRTFSNYTQPERRKLGEKVKSGGNAKIMPAASATLDMDRALQGIPIVMRMLGYATNV